MKVNVKLYASLAAYLPPNAVDNQTEMTVDDGITPGQIIAQLGLPGEMCHLVLINGVFVAPGERATKALVEGDTLAMWPPVAGG